MKDQENQRRRANARQRRQEARQEKPERERKSSRRILYMLGTIAAAVLILAIAMTLRSATDSESYKNYMQQAQSSYEAGNYNGALAALRKAAAIDRTEDCLMYMVDCYEQQGNYTKAIEVLRSMNTADPTVASRISAIDKFRAEQEAAGSISIAGRSYPLGTTSLVLEGKGLGDSIFTELEQLYALDSLSLANNEISNISAISRFGGIVSLNLSNNEISELLPLASLVNLRTLYLDNNPATDLTPLCALPNLTSLSIRGMELSQVQLDTLTNALPNCAIHSDTDADQVQDISFGGSTFKSDVTELKLSGMGIRDISALSNCKSLSRLDLSNNEISDLSPLMNLPELKWLNLSENEISNMRPLMGIDGLKYVNVAGNSISSTTPLSMMNGMTELYLDSNPINDFSGLRKVKSLNVLGLKNTGLDDEGMLYLGSISSLINLNIEDNPKISGEAVDKLREQLPSCNISHSELAYTIWFDGKQVRSDATELDLSSLGLRDVNNLSRLHKLEKLNLANNEVSNLYILEFTNSRASLKELNLANNRIEDITPLAGLGSIEVLDLSNNAISSELPLMQLKTLKRLCIGGTLLTQQQIDNLENSLLDCEIILD